MSTLYIRLASQAAAGSAPHWPALACPFALVSDGNLSHGKAIERQGTAPLPELSGTIAKAQRVVLLLAASDVSLLRLPVPPLSAARLKAALPNLVEEKLLCDPADCVIVASSLSDGLRTIAVVQRAWLDQLARTFTALGARRIEALPAQLCLSGQPGMVSAAIHQRDRDIDLTLRLSEQDGIGLAIDAEPGGAAHEVIQALCALVPAAPVTVYVPQAAMPAYQTALAETPAHKERISFAVDTWASWLTGARATTLDLMAGLGAGTGPKLDWRPWRWPLALAAAVLVTNASALNIDWWRMKSETTTLRAAMTQIYKSAYPKESVIIDPIAQMQQKLAIAKHDSGLAAPDDFTAITAAFGEAWASAVAAAGKSTAIAALEYHQRSLFVRLKQGGEAPTQQMQAALAKRDLALALAPEQSGAVVWQIRSAK